MLIKPFVPLKDIDEENDQIFKAVSTDIYYAPISQLYGAKVSVSRKFLIRGFTNPNGYTFVKVLYSFQADFIGQGLSDEEILNINPDLKLKYIIISVYDDKEEHVFGNTVYSVDEYSQNVNFVYVNEVANSKDIDRMSMDYTYTNSLHNDMRNINKEFKNTMFITLDSEDNTSFSIKRGVETRFLVNNLTLLETRKLSWFLERGKCTIHSYKTNLGERYSSFSDENLISISENIFTRANSPYVGTGIVNDLVCKKDCLDDFLSYMIKPNMLSMFDDITFIYENKKVTVKYLKQPFNKEIKPFIKKGLNSFVNFIEKRMLSFEDLVGNVRLIVNINDCFHYARCRILQDDSDTFPTYEAYNDEYFNELNNNLKDIVFKDEAIFRYLSEELYGLDYKFRNQTQLMSEIMRVSDLLNYYNGYKKDKIIIADKKNNYV